jgi:hypothetical protein
LPAQTWVCPFWHWHPSSIWPSQLLSIPSQISGCGCGALHGDQTPCEQVWVPVPQTVEHVRVEI